MKRHHQKRRQPERQPNDPTPQEIERQCREIRRGWSERVHRKRAGFEPEPFTVPLLRPYFAVVYAEEHGW